MLTRGAFITIEGIEGAGKSTSLATVERCLCAAGLDVVVTREPGGTSLGEAVRAWVLHGEHGPLSAEVETLLMFAARGQHVDEVIRPALDAGRWVVCDRFTDATYAYQGGGRGAERALLDLLVAWIQGSLRPDLTLLLDAPVDVGLGRIAGREHDHFERESAAFFERVRAAYLDLAARSPERVAVIDAARPAARVQQDIEARVTGLVAAFGGGARHA